MLHANVAERHRELVRRGVRRLRRPAHPLKSLAVGVGALIVLAVLAVFAASRAARALLVVGLLSILAAYLVAPVAERLRRTARIGSRRLLGRTTSVLFVYAAVALALTATWRAVVARVGRQLAQFADHLPEYVHAALSRTTLIESWPRRVGVPESVAGMLGTVTAGLSASLQLHVRAALEEVIHSRWLVPWLLLVPPLSFLLLTQFDTFRRSTLRVLPTGHLRWRGDEFFAQVNSVLAGYTRAQILSCGFVGLSASIGFAILRVPYAVPVGLATGVLEFFPVIGPVAAALLVSSLVTGLTIAWTIAFLIALRLVQDYVVYPRLLGKRMHLHPVAIVGAIWAGAALGGMVGVFCAVPVVGVGSVAYRHWREYRDIERLVRSHERELEQARIARALAASDPPNAAPQGHEHGGPATSVEPAPSAPVTASDGA